MPSQIPSRDPGTASYVHYIEESYQDVFDNFGTGRLARIPYQPIRPTNCLAGLAATYYV